MRVAFGHTHLVSKYTQALLYLLRIIWPLFIEHGSDEVITQACAYLLWFVKIYRIVRKQWQGKLS